MAELDKNNQFVAANATSDQDWQFVQQNRFISEKKLESKPTTYLRDAVHRFFKNRSSVVAGVILAIVIGFAILVPVVDTNNIVDPITEATYLPPKWFEANGSGFMDGTVSKSNVTIDPDTMLPVLNNGKTVYVTRSIIGGKDGITYNDAYYNKLTDIVEAYGRGGDVVVATASRSEDTTMYSPAFTYTVDHTYALTTEFDAEMCASVAGGNPTFALALLSDNFSSNTLTSRSVLSTVTMLQDYSSVYTPISISDLSSLIKADPAYVAAGSPASFTAELAYIVKTNVESDTVFPRIYVKNLTLKDSKASSSEQKTLDSIAWSDSTKMLGRTAGTTLSADFTWMIGHLGSLDVYNSKIIQGSFRYDAYDAAFGEEEGFLFGETVYIQPYIDKGWITYTWSNDDAVNGGVKSFKLTAEGEIHCPLRAVTAEKIKSSRFATTREVVGVMSWFRYYGYTSMPKYVFGTDGVGHDYFKVLFSGLRTSLALGALTAIITISFGIVWGSISGYFGGWTDILMERFTEILGGVPWIVMMTLIILMMKQSNFWVFLFALCLTSWMGVAAETRSQFYRYKGREYVLSSRTLGASDARLIFKHILPNGIGPVVTGVVLIVPSVIFSEASISYLLPGTLAFSGSQSFGVALSDAQSQIGLHPYMIICGSLIVSLLMICFNLFGNGLRDAFNPSLKGVSE